jgi:hypothetical protein
LFAFVLLGQRCRKGFSIHPGISPFIFRVFAVVTGRSQCVTHGFSNQRFRYIFDKVDRLGDGLTCFETHFLCVQPFGMPRCAQIDLEGVGELSCQPRMGRPHAVPPTAQG